MERHVSFHCQNLVKHLVIGFVMQVVRSFVYSFVYSFVGWGVCLMVVFGGCVWWVCLMVAFLFRSKKCETKNVRIKKHQNSVRSLRPGTLKAGYSSTPWPSLGRPWAHNGRPLAAQGLGGAAAVELARLQPDRELLGLAERAARRDRPGHAGEVRRLQAEGAERGGLAAREQGGRDGEPDPLDAAAAASGDPLEGRADGLLRRRAEPD